MEPSAAYQDTDKVKPSGRLLVVGIGASAGGIQALTAFFENVPANDGIAYVVVLHLSPDHDSELARILQETTSLRVSRVEQRTTLEANNVYVVSPSQHLKMADGYVDITPSITIEDRRAPVDIFFRTLAESHDSLAVAVILSGSGANGSMGLKRIKEKGGAVFAQNPREAQFGDMPRNAIATELVDDILNAGLIPAKIIAYRGSLGTVEIKIEPEKRPEEDQHALREVFTQLRVRTGHDFSNYKRATILRRIARRLSVREMPTLTAYAQYLRETPEEAHALLKDLLISVTNFFRDKESFEELEKNIIPRILAGKTNEDNIRVWVAGCATGEEAYTLAMLFAEQALPSIDSPKIQIFASDIDEHAIAIAREGLYTLNDAADVSPERLRRFFTAEPEGYRVRRELREMILFANHNLIKDPPFSHVELVTCRNLLIYFNSTAQERVMETIHFALNPGGYLFLGGSESVNGATDLFMQVNKDANIFQSRPMSNRFAYPVPESSSTFRFTKENVRTNQLSIENRETRVRERMTYGDLHQQLLEQYAPPSVVINEEYDIMHLSDKAGRFMQVAGGEPTQNLLKLVRSELRLELRTALYQAVQQGINVRAKNLKVHIGEGVERVDIHVRPVLSDENGARGFILVVFETVQDTGVEKEVQYAPPEPLARQLEDELEKVKTQLRASAEQFEVQAEELKASNEELQAMNEELRSAAEELETSKEELQSINEELVTVNQELKIKIDELSLTNNNFQNLVNSTDIPTVFLDRTLRVNMFTPAAREVYNLLPFDIGRPISDITGRIAYTNLVEDASLVLQKLQNIEKEITTVEGKTFLLRIAPYRTAEDRISGVVMVFIDISERIQAEEALTKAHANLTMALSATKAGWLAWDMLSGEAQWSEEGKKLVGFTSEEEAQNAEYWLKRVHPDDQPLIKAHVKEAIANRTGFRLEFRIIKPGGTVVWLLGAGNIQYDADGNATKSAGLIIDITERKEREDKLRESEERFRLLATASSDSMYIMSADWKEMYSLDGKNFLVTTTRTNASWPEDYLPDSDKPMVLAAIAESIRTKTPFELEHRVILADGSIGWTFSRAVPFLDEKGDIREWFGAATDITKRKREEVNLAFLAEVSQDLVRLMNIKDSMESLTRKIAAHFDVRAVAFADVDEAEEAAVVSYQWNDDNLPDLRGIYHISDFHTEVFREAARAGETYVVKDAATDARVRKDAMLALKIRSFISVPLVSDKRWQFQSMLSDTKPREWREDEVDLLREITNRIWTRLERTRAEDALRYSETRLRIVAKASGIGTWIRNMEEDKIELDDRTRELFGIPLEEYSFEDSINLLLHPDDKELFNELLAQTSDPAGNGVMNVEFRIIKPDGSLRWLHSVGQMFFDGEPKHAVMLVGSTVDITERKEREAALRESEERLRLTTEAADIYAWEYDIKEDRYSFSSNAASILGIEVKDLPLSEKDTLNIVHPDDKALVQDTLGNAIKEREGFSLDIRSLKSNGDTVWLSVQSTVITNTAGEAVRIIGIAQDVSRRKLQEQALSESEERYRAIFNQSTAAVSELDSEANILLANDTFCELLGYTQEEIVGMNIREFTHPDFLAGCLDTFARAVEKGESSTMEKKMIRRDGAEVWVTESVASLQDENEVTQSVVAVAIDITERKRAEMFVHESEERYRIALEAGELATWDWNLKTDRVKWNEQHFRLFGAEKEESEKNDTISPEYFLSFVYPEDMALVKQQLANVIGITGVYSAEFRIRRKDNGKLRWMSGYGRVTERIEGKPTRVSGVMLDTTDRKESEENLQATKNSLSTALEAAKMGVWELDLQTESFDRSLRHDQLLGFTSWQEEWNIETAKTHLIEEDKMKLDVAYQNLFDNGIFDVEFRVKSPDGSICWAHYYGRSFRAEDGKTETAAGVIFDITDQKTIDKQKDEFIGIASHELKTPVTSIKAYAEILQEMFEESNDEMSADLMSKLDKQVDRLNKLIKDLLDVTKVSEGQLHLVTQSFSLKRLIENVAEEMQRTTRQHEIKVTMKELPDITGDEERIGQVLSNLLSNAIKYSPGGSEVNVIAGYEDNAISISVVDNGIGMSPGTMEKLFARFFRSDNPSVRSYPGLGLGLFISMEIMKRHGGTISVESERGKGSVFTMILPLV